jgi:hypothetical protein
MRRVAVLAASAAGVLLMCFSQPALALRDPGWYSSHTATEKQAIVDYMYERTGHSSVPYSGDPATLADNAAQDAVDSSTHEFPLAPELGAEELSASEGVGLLPAIGEFVPVLSLAGAAFGAGVVIGTGVHRLFFEVESPEQSARGGTWSWNELRWQLYGTEIYFGARVQQRPGAYLYNAGYGGSTFPIARWFEEPCEFSEFSPPRGARLMTHLSTSATCHKVILGVEVEFPVYVDYPYVLASDIKPRSPLRPYEPRTDYAPYTVESPPNPGSEAVGSALEALDGEGYELLRSQLDYDLEPVSEPEDEPVRVGLRTEPKDEACKEYFGDAPGSDPGARAPGARREAADWDYDVESFEEVYNPLTDEEQTVELRWGTERWGYRRIVIRHGWNIAAAERTRLALQTDRAPVGDPRDITGRSFLYLYNIPSLPREMRCRQRVVVSYRTDELVPVGRHIVTSYVEAY